MIIIIVIYFLTAVWEPDYDLNEILQRWKCLSRAENLELIDSVSAVLLFVGESVVGPFHHRLFTVVEAPEIAFSKNS